MADKKERIVCKLCGAHVHAIPQHLKQFHPEITLEEYQAQFPNEPLYSEFAKQKMADLSKAIEAREKQLETGESEKVSAENYEMKPLAQTFGLEEKDGLNLNKRPIQIIVLKDDEKNKAYVPTVDEDYIFDPLELKYQLMAIQLNTPCLVWGSKGCGKTQGVEQICARTNRPFIRVQHTTNTEESHIVGQWVVKNGETVYQLGVLPLAMLNGWLYCADEYDFATPHVLSVYQSVLEGKPLIIKEAPEEMRIIKPHPNFRFFATGNTNGTGDESGNYAGTLIQNSANYDRFGIVVHKDYLKADEEVKMIRKRSGLFEDEARLFVEFAQDVRKAYAETKINDTISPRALINSARTGILLGNFVQGLRLAFTNKLSKLDEEICLQIAQRIFGNSIE